MLFGGLGIKERRMQLVLLSIVLLVTAVSVSIVYIGKKRYEEQTVMAKEFLEAGNYEQAIEAYLKAMSMRKSEHELLAIGLAEAYSGVPDYDKALEVLRDSYTHTGNLKVKEKIEEITARKTDYVFQQTVTHADNYYDNEEYDKAIIEYEKAKLIKSKEEITYMQIAKAYMAMGDYSQAREEVLEGLALTQNDQLRAVFDQVEYYFIKVKYEEMLASAQEYIVQENYEEAINIHLESIRLLPKEADAYKQLSEIYLALEDYEKAINTLENALRKFENRSLEEALDRVERIIMERDQRKDHLKELYRAVLSGDSDNIIRLLEDTYYIENITSLEPVYYSVDGEEENILNGSLMIIYDNNNIFAGDIKDGMKKGTGTYFRRLDYKDGKGWYYYKGEWGNDIPSGIGVTKEEQPVKDQNGETYNQRIMTEGIFLYGKENSQMKKTFYRGEQEIGSLSYWTISGVPQPLLNADGKIVSSAKGYVIGEWYRKGKPTGEYYSVQQNTVWGVKGYIKE